MRDTLGESHRQKQNNQPRNAIQNSGQGMAKSELNQIRDMNKPDAPRIIGELMRIRSGRHECNANMVSMDWLIAEGYATRCGFMDANLTDKGRKLADLIILRSGVQLLLEEF
jgi:hypothetical protein